jgi:hypothetical protein
MPSPQYAFLSLNPAQPVLAFRNEHDAKSFHHGCPTTTYFIRDRPDHWLYVIPPAGLHRVYKSREGNHFVFDFKSLSEASRFNESIRNIGSLKIDMACHIYRVYVKSN